MFVTFRDKALVAQPSVSANIAIASTDDDDFSGKRDDPAHVTLVATQAAPPPIPWISIWKSPAFLVLLYNHFASMICELFVTFSSFIFAF